MRVLVVGDAASINVRRWCEGLLQEGFDVTLLSFEEQWRPDIPVRRLPSFRIRHVARYLTAIPSARGWAAGLDPDMVIGYFVSGYGTVARGIARRPLVQVTAGLDVINNPPGTTRHRITRRNLTAADLVIAWGPHMCDAVQAFGVPEQRIMVQPRGIPLDGYRPRTLDTSSPATRVIVTRALEPVYRHDLILAAVAHVSDPRLTLTVVGDGSLRSSLETEADRLRITDRVHFLGRVSNEDLPALLHDHDIYVSARPHDGVSASLLEAMAGGLVPVVPDHPANRDWLDDGTTGVLAALEVGEFAEALRRAATDPVLRRHAAERNPEVVSSRGSLDSNMRRFAQRFRELHESHVSVQTQGRHSPG